jgi:homocitrate synthase NifV
MSMPTTHPTPLAQRNIVLEDTTLRDGEQAPGIAFSKAAKLEILDALIALGVRWIEVGIPAMGGEELDTLRASLERREQANLVAWNRGRVEDVQQSLDLGFRHIHIGLPSSAIHLANSVGKDRAWLLEQAVALVKRVKDAGAFVSISAEDVGRTDTGFLQEYAGRVAQAGADRLRLSDTIGMLDPAGYARVVRDVARASAIPTQCHCHNDFGLAVANTLAGLEAGASWFHVCVNGMGERAGMPDLATMAMSLRHFHQVDLGLDLGRLKQLSELVARHTRTPLQPWYPVVGDNVFSHESGIHSNGMLKDARTFEPFPPEQVGGQRRIVIGKHSGKAGIRHVLAVAGEAIDDAVLDDCLVRVRRAAIESGTAVAPDQLVAIYRNLTAEKEHG